MSRAVGALMAPSARSRAAAARSRRSGGPKPPAPGVTNANHWPAFSTAESPSNTTPGPASTLPCAPGAAAEQAPALRALAREVDAHAAVVRRLVDAAQAHAAAILADAAGIRRPARSAVSSQRIFDLQRLDRQVRGVGDVDVHAVQPVLVGARAAAAADRLEIDPGRAVVRPLADEVGHGAGRVRAGHDALGHRLRQRAEDQVGDALAGLQRGR